MEAILLDGQKIIKKVPDTLDEQIYKDVKEKFNHEEKIHQSYDIKNTHRAVGTRLSHYIYNKFKKKKLNGDALITNVKKVALGILVADCVPVLIYDKNLKIISAIHAGWKSIYKEIIKKLELIEEKFEFI